MFSNRLYSRDIFALLLRSSRILNTTSNDTSMASELPDIAFFITVHATDLRTEQYWKESYTCIRKFHPTTLVILIDDNSPFLIDENFSTTNCLKVKSKYPGKAEILPYYYFLKLKPAKKAIFLHDSVFINSQIKVEDVETYQPLWSFATPHPAHDEYGVKNFLKEMRNHSRLIDFFEHADSFKGACFGSMSIISWAFLSSIDKEFNVISVAIRLIDGLYDRMTLERVLGYVFTTADQSRTSLYGDIFQWCHSISLGAKHPRPPCNLFWEDYQVEKEYYKTYPIIKVFTGRTHVK